MKILRGSIVWYLIAIICVLTSIFVLIEYDNLYKLSNSNTKLIKRIETISSNKYKISKSFPLNGKYQNIKNSSITNCLTENNEKNKFYNEEKLDICIIKYCKNLSENEIDQSFCKNIYEEEREINSKKEERKPNFIPSLKPFPFPSFNDD